MFYLICISFLSNITHIKNYILSKISINLSLLFFIETVVKSDEFCEKIEDIKEDIIKNWHNYIDDTSLSWSNIFAAHESNSNLDILQDKSLYTSTNFDGNSSNSIMNADYYHDA